MLDAEKQRNFAKITIKVGRIKMKLLTAKDAEKIVEFMQLEGDRNQILNTHIFSQLLLVRNLLFNSRLICLGDETEDGKITKIFSVILPPEKRTDMSTSLIALYLDEKFLKECLITYRELMENEKYKKIKFQIDGFTLNETLFKLLLSCGFKQELKIKTNTVDLAILSWFY